MKDIIITGKRIKIELFTLLACFIIAEAHITGTDVSI